MHIQCALEVPCEWAFRCTEVTQSYLSRLRCDKSFKEFYTSVAKEAEQHTEDPVLPRSKRPPRRIDEGDPPHQFQSAEDYYRSFYFEALDLVSEQMRTHFNQDSLAIPKELEKLSVQAANQQAPSQVNVPSNLLK